MDVIDDVVEAALRDANALEEKAKLNLKDDELSSIQALSAEMMRLEDAVSDLEGIAKVAKENLRSIREELLPDAMLRSELKSIELSDGSKLSVAKKYIGAITKAKEDAALAWFKETKRIGVITPKMTIDVDKGHLDEAERYFDQIKEMGIPVSLKPSVHWQTLRAVVRELYENGEPIPDCISAHVINEAKIKRK